MLQLIVRSLPHIFRAALIKQLIYAEISLQLKMCPVIQRIAQRVRHGSRPGQELFVRLRSAGAVAFRHTVGAHRPPFVVITLKPNFGEIAKTMVVRNVLGGKVAVIVEDRLIGRVIAVELPCRLCM